MSARLLIFIIVHIVGAIITLVIHYKDGTFEQITKNRGGFEAASPSDLVFWDLAGWEIFLILYVICTIGGMIDNFFENKFNKNERVKLRGNHMRARIYCEVTCGNCGGLAYKSGYYKNKSTISELKEKTKDWIWDEELCMNLCPECQKKLKKE